MKWFRDARIFLKLTVLIAIAGFSLVGVSAVGYYYMDQINGNAKRMYNGGLLPVQGLNQTREHFRGIEADIWQVILTNDKVEEQKLLTDIQGRAEAVDKLLTAYEKNTLGAYEQERLPKLRTAMQEYRAERQKAVDLAVAGKKQEAYVQYKSAASKIDAQTELLDELADFSSQQAEKLEVDNTHSFDKARMILLAVCVAVAGLCVILGLAIANMIVKPIGKLQQLMGEAGEGNLTVKGQVVSKDEIGSLTASFNQMIGHQDALVRQVRQAIVQLAASSDEMAASSEEVTSTTVEIANSVQQVARNAEHGNQSTIEVSQVLLELSSLVQIANNKAGSAGKNSQTTNEVAKEGKSTVADAIKSMVNIKAKTLETEELIAKLSKHSEQIGLVTDTITGIARQTNLLALNAAIEAARAGEAGRGFSVVAEEVRKLAEQSNTGAGEVARLVGKVAEGTTEVVAATQISQAEIEQGVIAVNKAGQALESILSAVESTVTDVTGIINITHEEVATSDKIVKLIDTVARGIEDTAANAEEVSASTEETSAAMQTIAASAEEMSAMAHELDSAIKKFKV